MHRRFLFQSSVPAQLSTFTAVGVLQYVIDVALFFICYTLFGLPVIFNVVSRAVAASIGYYLNGKITFQAGESLNDFNQLFRFIVLWILMTILSSSAIGGVQLISEKQAWPDSLVLYSKPVIEIVLFLLSFSIQKIWVFRKSK